MRRRRRRGNVTLRDVIRRGCDMWHVRAQSLPSVVFPPALRASLPSPPSSLHLPEKGRRNSSACSSVVAAFSSVDIWRLCQGGRGSLRWRQNWRKKRRFVIWAGKRRRARVPTIPGSSPRIEGWLLVEQKLKSCLMRSNSLQTQRNESSISPRVSQKLGSQGAIFLRTPFCSLASFRRHPFLDGLLPARLIVELALRPFHFELSIDTSFLNWGRVSWTITLRRIECAAAGGEEKYRERTFLD